MDKTEQFIKMADCPEIQKKRRFLREGDWAYERYDNAKYSEVVTIGRFGYISNTQLSSCGYDYDFFEYERKRFVWLPRQDQIHRMIGKTELAFCIYQIDDNGDKWGGEIYRDREQIFTIEMDSPEQLWLAFYMWEKHKKIWDGEKWVA